MSSSFNTVGLVGKPDARHIGELLQGLYSQLTRQGRNVMVEQGSAPFLKDVCGEVHDFAALSAACDLAIVVGGDGTLLRAARALAPAEIPLIGVNLGRLGFLVDVLPTDAFARIDAMLNGEYDAEERVMLRATIVRNGVDLFEQTAINEVVVHSWNATSLIELETWIDGKFLNAQRSDGLIVSTPTGSTAYALSAGGPILSPELKAIVLAPVNPHTLSNRPIVIDGRSRIEIAFCPSKQFRAQLVCDNVLLPEVQVEDRIVIRAEPKPFRILHPTHYDFFDILRAKLNWSSGYRS